MALPFLVTLFSERCATCSGHIKLYHNANSSSDWETLQHSTSGPRMAEVLACTTVKEENQCKLWPTSAKHHVLDYHNEDTSLCNYYRQGWWNSGPYLLVIRIFTSVPTILTKAYNSYIKKLVKDDNVIKRNWLKIWRNFTSALQENCLYCLGSRLMTHISPTLGIST